MKFLVYDLEVFPNCFLAGFRDPDTGSSWFFESSDRKNQVPELRSFLNWIKQSGIRMVGFNNQGFDAPIISECLTDISWGCFKAYQKCQSIINSENRPWSPPPPLLQVDLFQIWHFSNKAKSQSLKGLELAMRMDSVVDLPYPPGTYLTPDQMDVLLHYLGHDLTATVEFFKLSTDQIRFRDELSAKYGKDFTNFSDVKCGVEVLTIEAERANPGSCYDERGKPRQTLRPSISLGEVILPSVQFLRPEFQAILDQFRAKVIVETKGAFEDINAVVDGFTFVYGLGGIHGSIESGVVRSDATHVVVDLDVASYYPNLAIVNDIYPEHLSSGFCDTYKMLYEERKKHKKGSAENSMLKLALNGAYGNSNNLYSPLYDPKYTMAITINGQLLLSMLAERMMMIPGLTMVQANTDGITVRVPREHLWAVETVAGWWQAHTGLVMETVEYGAMFVRDVNNYLSVTTGGKIKRKGAYEYKYELHQNPSMVVVAMCAEAVLLGGVDPMEYIRSCGNPHDFTIRAKVSRSDRLCDKQGNQYQRIGRYYVSKGGIELVKHSPPKGPVGGWKVGTKGGIPNGTGPLDAQGVPHDPNVHTKNMSTYKECTTSLTAGQTITMCNDISEFNWATVDYDWYLKEVEKLTGVFT